MDNIEKEIVIIEPKNSWKKLEIVEKGWNYYDYYSCYGFNDYSFFQSDLWSLKKF
jgi:hypothetical protein